LLQIDVATDSRPERGVDIVGQPCVETPKEVHARPAHSILLVLVSLGGPEPFFVESRKVDPQRRERGVPSRGACALAFASLRFAESGLELVVWQADREVQGPAIVSESGSFLLQRN
jgi:hypothetical protein